MGAALRRRLCAAVVSRQHLYNVCFVASRHAAASRLILRQSRHWVVMFVISIFRATPHASEFRAVSSTHFEH